MKNAQPIGQLKASKKVACEICTMEIKRTANVLIYENTAEKRQAAMQTIYARLAKPYTCRVCQTISNYVK